MQQANKIIITGTTTSTLFSYSVHLAFNRDNNNVYSFIMIYSGGKAHSWDGTPNKRNLHGTLREHLFMWRGGPTTIVCDSPVIVVTVIRLGGVVEEIASRPLLHVRPITGLQFHQVNCRKRIKGKKRVWRNVRRRNIIIQS